MYLRENYHVFTHLNTRIFLRIIKYISYLVLVTEDRVSSKRWQESSWYENKTNYFGWQVSIQTSYLQLVPRARMIWPSDTTITWWFRGIGPESDRGFDSSKTTAACRLCCLLIREEMWIRNFKRKKLWI